MTNSATWTDPYDGINPNGQPITKTVHKETAFIDVNDVFYTLQGEGPFSGRPAVFIRLAGCNLQCPMCDTEYGLKGTYHTEDLVNEAAELPLHDGGLVVITGGEPFRQPAALTYLITGLVDSGYSVQIETNGTLAPPDITVRGLHYSNHIVNGNGVYIIVSPKTGKVHPETEARALAYKYVLDHESIDPDDGLPIQALGHTVKDRVARPPMGRDGQFTKPVYVQPCETQDPNRDVKNHNAVAKSCMDYGYTAQLQMHKYMGLK